MSKAWSPRKFSMLGMSPTENVGAQCAAYVSCLLLPCANKIHPQYGPFLFGTSTSHHTCIRREPEARLRLPRPPSAATVSEKHVASCQGQLPTHYLAAYCRGNQVSIRRTTMLFADRPVALNVVEWTVKVVISSPISGSSMQAK